MDINDGKGIYDSDGLIDTIIADCNNLGKHMMDGQFIQFCNTIVGMTQKLVQLKAGIRADRESRDRTINEMRQCNDELARQMTGLPVGDDMPAVTEDEI